MHEILKTLNTSNRQKGGENVEGMSRGKSVKIAAKKVDQTCKERKIARAAWRQKCSLGAAVLHL